MTTSKKRIYIFTGGTTSVVAPHFSVCSEAYGAIGEAIHDEVYPLKKEHHRKDGGDDYEVFLIRTVMALVKGRQNRLTEHHFGELGLDPSLKVRTNQDVEDVIKVLIKQPETKCIIMSCALNDFDPVKLTVTKGSSKEVIKEFGTGQERLSSDCSYLSMKLKPTKKIIDIIRKDRKDIFLVSFKATAGDDIQTTYVKALNNLKRSSSNLVFANDVVKKNNMIVTPEEFPYHCDNREGAVSELVKMVYARLRCRFTRSTVLDTRPPVAWGSDEVPSSLRTVVDHCINKGAYKPFRGSTVGHFAFRGDIANIYTSIRKTDFNEIDKVGLVEVRAVDSDTVLAFGAKPSVGGQSQRIIFNDHKGYDCIVHFHCPMKEKKRATKIPTVPQWQNECGSHECGQNTSNGLVEVADGIKAVMLENHGPNIVFKKNVDPKKVIKFIESNWDLGKKTGGLVNVS